MQLLRQHRSAVRDGPHLVQEIAEPLMLEIRYLDKLIDELARG